MSEAAANEPTVGGANPAGGADGDPSAYPRIRECPRTQECPGGPLLVRGASAWTDDDGDVHPVTRPVVAVCRCQRSQRQPWCDGTHKFVTEEATKGSR